MYTLSCYMWSFIANVFRLLSIAWWPKTYVMEPFLVHIKKILHTETLFVKPIHFMSDCAIVGPVFVYYTMQLEFNYCKRQKYEVLLKCSWNWYDECKWMLVRGNTCMWYFTHPLWNSLPCGFIVKRMFFKFLWALFHCHMLYGLQVHLVRF